ncbi:hotdog fold thioesterase [Bacillus thuringiensis]|uniref:hotdog fold thioesterase n=1 Tax=Bacillus thuringiensis TaxID=1428 RepID=UPI002AB386AC|nr:hotdog fold thioesterase [Bacillus thuringiensis]MDY8165831.1 hotdog fold thioesterase [Bacillus thuringiensis]
MQTILDALGIEIVEVSSEKVIAIMPVHDATKQPFGQLHGGASVVLAETVASVGSWNLLDIEKEYAVGLEINANHISGKSDGVVKAIGTPIHKGRTTMVWEIKIVDEKETLICISRCTMAVIKRKKEK